jgi:hypothetical protein
MTLAAIVRKVALPSDVPHDADVIAWLGAEPPTPSSPRRDGVITGPSGWAVARVSDCIVFLRAGSYRHRPSHLDALHLDVRARGREIVTDPGTYSYNAPAPWNNGLVAAEVHNGPILEGEELGRRGPHFLWLSWPSARIVSAEYCDGNVRLVAERAGAVRREVYVTGDRVVVTDRAPRAGARSMQITWLLHPTALADQPIMCAEGECLKAHLGETVGWYSPTYGLRLSSQAIRIRHPLGQGASAVQTIILLPRAGAVHKS